MIASVVTIFLPWHVRRNPDPLGSALSSEMSSVDAHEIDTLLSRMDFGSQKVPEKGMDV